ncbi:epoxide hydrolase family protein [Streptomyces sp. NPDC049879]|uniref:epoxide hydrolase family protein n=1 Tax=Streptomyces sp. NPDC049879 TaxID=3365598 RepID=UPI00379BACF0
MTGSTAIRPFRIDVPQRDVDDLRDRLARARWTRRLGGADWGLGVPTAYLRELAAHWRDGFDWRAVEGELNGLPQFMTELDGYEVHFVHVRSPEPDALPLVLAHGWPHSFVEFADLVGRLADPRAHGADPAAAFHVVIPSVPGFGFSSPPREGLTLAGVGRMWSALMRRLGYERYGVQGGDLGAYIAPEVAKADPDRVAGVYITGGLGFPTEADVPGMSDEERKAYEELRSADWVNGVDHHALLRAAPRTFAHGWHDSPVAALAWMAQKFHEFSMGARPADRMVGRDRFLANLSLYWFTDTFGTSSWPMYTTTGLGWPEGQKAVPTGVYSGAPGIRRLAERHNTVVHWPEGNTSGHHFVALSDPGPYAADLRAFFRLVR